MGHTILEMKHENTREQRLIRKPRSILIFLSRDEFFKIISRLLFTFRSRTCFKCMQSILFWFFSGGKTSTRIIIFTSDYYDDDTSFTHIHNSNTRIKGIIIQAVKHFFKKNKKLFKDSTILIFVQFCRLCCDFKRPTAHLVFCFRLKKLAIS